MTRWIALLRGVNVSGKNKVAHGELLAGDGQGNGFAHGCARWWLQGICAVIQASTSDSSQTVTRGERGIDLGKRPRSISQYRWERETPVRLSTSARRRKRSGRPASAWPGGSTAEVWEPSMCPVAALT